MDEMEFNKRVFEFIKDHLDFDYDYRHDSKRLYLKLKNPESNERIELGYVEITEAERKPGW